MVEKERRHTPRKSREIDFHCYVEGHRFDSSTVDISASGAFLRTRAEVRRDTLVILHPKKAAVPIPPVVLVGTVVRQVDGYVSGLGVKWLKCFSMHGASAVYDFLLFFLEMSAASVPIPSQRIAESPGAGFDFQKSRFYRVNIPQQDEPDAGRGKTGRYRTVASMPDEILDPTGSFQAAELDPEIEVPAEPLLSPPEHPRSDGDGIVTSMLGVSKLRVPVKFPVRVVSGSTVHKGTVREIGLTTILVITHDDVDPGEDDVSIDLPVPLKSGTTWVRLQCRELSEGDSRAGVLDLHVKQILDESKPGLYERFVRYLCQKMLADH